MSYADLREQAFDYDPQRAALQQQQNITTTPANGTLEERLEHYRRKGTMDQHDFFTRVTVEEWEEAGDWFLMQFAAVMGRMRQARREKRAIVQRFEEDIAAREEAVRGKMEGIAQTLEDLKQEGQTMMEGRDMDLET